MEGILPLTHLDPLVTVSAPHPELLSLTMLLVLRGPGPGDPKWEVNPGWRQDFVLQPGGFPAVCLAAQTWVQCFTSHHLGEVQFVIARPSTQVFLSKYFGNKICFAATWLSCLSRCWRGSCWRPACSCCHYCSCSAHAQCGISPGNWNAMILYWGLRTNWVKWPSPCKWK